jgi:uncharacterized protein YndB with AHSA1/START domain/uncharacterized protein YciI
MTKAATRTALALCFTIAYKALVLSPALHAQTEEPPMPSTSSISSTPVHFIVQLHGTRDGWPADMTPDEERIMQEHFIYLKNLMHEGRMLLAGPCMDPVYGLVVLEVADEADARQLMDNEPSVVGGVHTYTLHPFTASLLYGRDRLPEKETSRQLRKEVIVEAPRDSVWEAWATPEGIASFSAPEANIEFKVGGKYEWLFVLDAPAGSRGGEGCRILSYLPKEMLSFSWNAPPKFPEAREYRTRVVLQFADAGPGRTKVTLTHLGWGDDKIWDPVYDYFDVAWGYVLTGLQKRFNQQ